MNVLIAFALVALLSAAAFLGGTSVGLRTLFGVYLPYAAVAVFLVGVILKVLAWAKVPVPFRIPTTCGQQKSLPWVQHSRLDSPFTFLGVVGRMALEVLLFRSLFRNTKVELREGPRLVYGEEKWLWLAAMAFHWSFLVVFVRHLRFFMEPVPWLVGLVETADSFFQIGAPILYLTDLFILAALAFLLFRRLYDPQVRYLSLLADYFPLLLLIGLCGTGVLMRYFTRVDIVAIKELAMGLVTFRPVVPQTVGPLFFVHLFLLSVLIAYFPFSKLMHLGGVFLSPTRNLANNNRAKRHVNPWNYPVKVHTYAEWEEEFHDKIKMAGLPLDKE
ncbi:MAG: sulfate reduction electron transfer complex DsrMKJOP subunit DsrM [Acidobacteriota bacterium]